MAPPGFAPLVYKKSTRLSPNNANLSLTGQSVSAVTKMLISSANELAENRNGRNRKSARGYLSMNIPASLHQDILEKAWELSVGVESILNLMDLFEPGQDAKDSVDLVGSSSTRFGCSRAGRSLWFVRHMEELNLTVTQLEKLYNILIWANPYELRELALSATVDDLKSSKIPNILARGHDLTKVTLLAGADNHIMRILGTNCPRLKYLNVSYSPKVTAQGILNLLLSRPLRRKEYVWGHHIRSFIFDIGIPFVSCQRDYEDRDLISRTKNPCSETILSIQLTGTGFELGRGCDYACKLLEHSYIDQWRTPFKKIVRKLEAEGVWERGITFNPVSGRFPSCAGLDYSTIFSVSRITSDLRKMFDDPTQAVMDHLLVPERKPSGGKKSLLFIHRPNSHNLRIHMKVVGNFVTSLVLSFEQNFDVNTIGIWFKHLKSLRGFITDAWRVDEPFLPNLEVSSIWCDSSRTILSILRNAPSIKLCEFNNLQIERDILVDTMLTDSTLEDCLNQNRSLAGSLEEFIIRPCRLLTVTSIKTLASNCPNLKLIGDVQSWKCTSRQITTVNNYLKRINSRCVLSVMNKPQPKLHNYEWI